jgi:hypothetical protein
MMLGAMKIGRQFLNAHRHHSEKELKRAMYRGPEVPGLAYQPRSNQSVSVKSRPIDIGKAAAGQPGN